jgi:CheY-like chemotaxis protein
VTGLGREEDRRRSAEAGIDLHLLKPADPEALQKVLEQLQCAIRRPRRPRAGAIRAP